MVNYKRKYDSIIDKHAVLVPKKNCHFMIKLTFRDCHASTQKSLKLYVSNMKHRFPQFFHGIRLCEPYYQISLYMGKDN